MRTLDNEHSVFPVDGQAKITHNSRGVAASSPGRREPARKPGFATSESYGFQESETHEIPEMPDSFEVLSKRDLIALLRRRERRFDDVDLELLRLATVTFLESWLTRARESKCVLEASDFARWVLYSGLMKLFKGAGAGEVEKARKEVLWACECAWKHQGSGPSVALSQVEAINAKLDLVLSQLASPVASGGGKADIPPALHVLSGGAS